MTWLLDTVGGYGSGPDREQALRAARDRCGGQVEVVEEVASVTAADGYIINAFFEDDRRPVTATEVAQARTELDWLLARLIRAYELRPDAGAAQVVDHIVRAEQWYFQRIDLPGPLESLPDDPVARLRAVHIRTSELTPRLIADHRVTEKSGERWSARKVLRRTLWHRQDHLAQLEALA